MSRRRVVHPRQAVPTGLAAASGHFSPARGSPQGMSASASCSRREARRRCCTGCGHRSRLRADGAYTGAHDAPSPSPHELQTRLRRCLGVSTRSALAASPTGGRHSMSVMLAGLPARVTRSWAQLMSSVGPGLAAPPETVPARRLHSMKVSRAVRSTALREASEGGFFSTISSRYARPVRMRGSRTALVILASA